MSTLSHGENTDIETTRKPKVPLICLLSTGSDPSPQIESIAKVGLIDQPLISFIIHTFISHTFLSHSQESRSEFCQGRAQEYRSLALGQVTIKKLEVEGERTHLESSC